MVKQKNIGLYIVTDAHEEKKYKTKLRKGNWSE